MEGGLLWPFSWGYTEADALEVLEAGCSRPDNNDLIGVAAGEINEGQ